MAALRGWRLTGGAKCGIITTRKKIARSARPEKKRIGKEDLEERNDRIEGEVKISTPLMAKIENYWYHYKWHTIVAIFLVITVLVASLQMCTRTSYDVHIMYAGNHKIEKISTNGNSTTPFSSTLASFGRVVPDLNGDGEVHVNLLDLFVMTAEEVAEFNKTNDGTTEINEIQIKENTTALEANYLLFGDYYIMLLSPALFEKYDEQYDGALFADISRYASGEVLSSLSLTENRRGVYLSSLGIYSMIGIEGLPADTVVCIRNKTAFGNGSNEANHGYSEAAFKEILKYSNK